MRSRSLVLRGSHDASGVLIGGTGVDEATLRARVLAAWEPGAVVHAVGARVLVVFASLRRMRAESAPGALVIAHGAALRTLELDDATHGASPALVEARAGALVAHPLGPATILQLDRWIALDGIEFVDATPLGPPLAPAAPIVRAPADAREAIGAAIPARERAADAMRAALARGDDDDADPALPPGAGSLASRFVEWARGLFGARSRARTLARPSLVARLLSWLRSPSSSTSSSLALPSPPGPVARALAWLRGRAASLALRSRLGRLVARRQAEYLARMLELFDRGDIGEALRWAIPLGGEGNEPASPALGVPRARDALTISPSRRGGGSSLLVGGGLYGLLRERYLAALRALVARGAIDEAAFVLAELLADAGSAVSLLEEHRRFEQAARLAESRELPAEVAVRLWILAKQPERALVLARRHDAFAPAISLLGSSHPELARALALRWADVLASGGDFAGAVDAIADHPGGAALAAVWIDRAVELGGVVGARMLARRAVVLPARWSETRDAARTLLDDDSRELAPARLEFAHALAAAPSRPETRVLARAALRAMVRDRALGLAPGGDLLSALESLAEDGAMRADRPTIPPVPSSPPLAARTDALVIHVAAPDRGALPVRDAALLPDGRVLVALGDAGVRVLARDGRVVAKLDAPADALVVSDSGARAIAVARRGTIDRLSRIDVAARRAETWGHAMLGSFARSFDGHRWLVAEHDGVKIVDAIDAGWRALWALPRERAMHVERGPGHLSLATISPVAPQIDPGGELEVWRYDERGMALRARTPVADPLVQLETMSLALRPETWLVGVDHRDEALLQRVHPHRDVPFDGTPIAGALVARPLLLAHAACVEAGVRIDVRSTATLEPVLHVLLDGSTHASLRLAGDLLVIGDDRGRVLVIDLASGERIRDLRVRP